VKRIGTIYQCGGMVATVLRLKNGGLCRRVKNPLLVFEGGKKQMIDPYGTLLEQAADKDILCIVIHLVIHLIVAINVVIIKMVILSVISISVSLDQRVINISV
jgi:hypothetical protein